MNYPDDETGQVLTEMAQAGIDLSQQHDVVFFQLFEQKEQAQQMANFISETMTEVSVSVHLDVESPNIWDLDCTIKMVPSYDDVVSWEANFEKIAAKYNGYNDGWGIEA